MGERLGLHRGFFSVCVCIKIPSKHVLTLCVCVYLSLYMFQKLLVNVAGATDLKTAAEKDQSR